MEIKHVRPTLNDPAEFALIKEIYFKDDRRTKELEVTDPIERLERQESRARFNKKSSR